MAVKRDYYETLGVSKSADASAIKKAYRKLAKKYHPDTNSGDPAKEQKFKEITEAYSVLSDPEKKKLYDQFGHAAFDGSGAGAYGNGAGSQGGFGSYTSGYGPQGNYREYHFEGNMDDIFGDLFGGMFRGSGRGGNRQDGRSGSGFGNHFSDDGFGGFSGFGQDFRQKGSDVTAEVTVSFDEAAFGCDKVITYQNPGEKAGARQRLSVHIPAGIESGKSIRLRGKGMPGAGGGEAGDLLLKVTVREKPGFERKGMDVYTTVNIPFTTAVFGGEARVQTLYGDVLCKIQPGTQSGTKIRLRGKGIVSMKDSSVHGDQYAVVQIEVPQNLSREAKQKLKEFERACGQTSRGNGFHAA